MALSGMVEFDFSMYIKDLEIAEWQGIIIIYYKHKPRKSGIECVGAGFPFSCPFVLNTTTNN